MHRIVLDAGALIALERNDRAVWAALKLAALESDDREDGGRLLATLEKSKGRPR